MNNKPTLFDILLILSLIGASFFFIYRNHFNNFSAAEVFINGVSQKLDISKDASIKLKENFVIEIKSKKVRVALSDCPKKICKHSGWISKPGDSIVCIPNKIAIVIKGKNRYDAISR